MDIFFYFVHWCGFYITLSNCPFNLGPYQLWKGFKFFKCWVWGETLPKTRQFKNWILNLPPNTVSVFYFYILYFLKYNYNSTLYSTLSLSRFTTPSLFPPERPGKSKNARSHLSDWIHSASLGGVAQWSPSQHISHPQCTSSLRLTENLKGTKFNCKKQYIWDYIFYK